MAASSYGLQAMKRQHGLYILQKASGPRFKLVQRRFDRDSLQQVFGLFLNVHEEEPDGLEAEVPDYSVKVGLGLGYGLFGAYFLHGDGAAGRGYAAPGLDNVGRYEDFGLGGAQFYLIGAGSA